MSPCTRVSPVRQGLLAVLLVLCGGGARAAGPLPSCGEDDRVVVASPGPVVVADAQPVLARLAREAVARSAEVASQIGSSRAYRQDQRQAEAGAAPQLALSGSAVWGRSRNDLYGSGDASQAALGLTLSAPLYDGGRVQAEAGYYRGLAEAGESGVLAVREQVALETLLGAIERRRQQRLLQVWDRQVGRMQCLVRQIGQIVELDRGRGSELVQAGKSLRQAELSRAETGAQLRQAEVRLQRLAGLPPAQAELPETLPAELPVLQPLLDALVDVPEIRQLQRQAEALDRYAQALRAADAPQLRWQIGATQARQPALGSTNWNAGLVLNMTLADGGASEAGVQAAVERAEAARRQREARLEDRTRQLLTLHEAAQAAQARIGRFDALLADSEQLRRATFEQWARLGRRSLFDLISAETEHYQLLQGRVQAEHELLAALLQLRALGSGLLPWLAPELVPVTPMR
ncbi:MAG: TolC family protein [Sphaerotilus natans]